MIRARESESSNLVHSRAAAAVSCALNCACVRACVRLAARREGRQQSADNLRFRNSYHCVPCCCCYCCCCCWDHTHIHQQQQQPGRHLVGSVRVDSKSPDAWAKQSKSKASVQGLLAGDRNVLSQQRTARTNERADAG